jgi:N-acetylmuramoyl-L-alanine amidase
LRIQKYLIVIITLASILALVGCGESNYYPSINSQPSYSVSISQLASRLGLTVQKTGSPYYELTSANNRVLLFTYEGGRVYVNGDSVCSVGATTQVGSVTYVSELLIPKIRGHLITSYTPSVVIPDNNAYRSASGTVVIDAGHGGKDPGATSYTGDYEKNANLSIARKVASHLENRGVQVIMTRNSDTFVELNERAAIANRAGADLFVSIHCDAHQSRSQNGYTIYVARSASWSAKKIGVAINQSMGQTGFSSKGVRNEDFRVLVRTACPAVLIECGYLTNPSEAALLYDSNFQDRIARAITDGIINSL